MKKVRIIGAGITKQGRLDASAQQLAVDAVRQALADAEIPAHEVSHVVVSNALGGCLVDQECVRGQAWLRGIGLTAPVLNVDNGCGGGATALHMGYLAVLAGQSPVLVLGVEKMWTGSRDATLAGIEQCLAADERSVLRSAAQASSGSVFMGLNAEWAALQIDARATTREQFAAAAVKAYRHGALNPVAQHRRPVAVEEVLDATAVAGPLTRLMCTSFTDGAAAVVLGQHGTHAPAIRASILRSGDGTLEYHDRMAHTAELAWKAAALGPHDLDLIEVHDATSAEELYAIEALGLYDAGEAGAATQAGETAIGGTGTVVNPSGGLLARGHPIGATGVCQIVELTYQLRGTAGARQVEGATAGAAVNTGGIISGDVGAIGIHVVTAT